MALERGRFVLYQGLKKYFQELSQSITIVNYGLFVGSGIISIWFAKLAYQWGSTPQVYSDFIVGGNTWFALGKQQDYFLLFGLILGYLAGLLVFSAIHVSVRIKIGEGAARAFLNLLTYTSFPALIWLPGAFFSKNLHTDLLGLSLFLILLLLIVTLALLLFAKVFWKAENHFGEILSESLLFMALMGSTGSILIFLVSRSGPLFGFEPFFMSRGVTHAVIAVFVGIGLFPLIAMTRKDRSSSALQLRYFGMNRWSQLGLPLAFFMIHPAFWSGGSSVDAYTTTFYAWFLPVALAGFAYLDLSRRIAKNPKVEKGPVLKRISPLCLVGLLLFLKMKPLNGPNVPTDSYHYGEFFTAWWSWQKFNLTPFWDFVPARGLLNYLPGSLNTLLFDGTASSFPATAPYLAALVLLLCFPIVAVTIGIAPAFLGFILMPLPDGVFSIHFALTAALCLCCRGVFRWRPVAWLLTWFATGVSLVLFATGQGGLWVLATLPMGGWVFWRAWREQRPVLIKAGGTLLLGLVMLGVFTPVGKMIWGAIRYGLEQSTVNSLAHGLAWAENLGNSPLNLFYEMVRSSWIGVALFAGTLLLLAPGFPSGETRQKLLVYATPIFILCVLFVIRAAGRIDAGGPSRLGQASIWALTLLLPILLFAAHRKTKMAPGKLAVFVALAAMMANLYSSVPRLDIFLNRLPHSETRPITKIGYIEFNGRQAGLPNLGRGQINQQHYYTLQGINRFLQMALDEHETYLDISGHGANYFYLNRRPPIEVIAPYNLVAINQQIRAVTALKADLPPVVLAYAFNDNHDGGPLGLRSPLLYRFLLSHYVPVQDGVFIWLVRPDRLARITGTNVRNPLLESQALQKAFGIDNLWQIPIAWGRSFASLQEQMIDVYSLEIAQNGVDLSNGNPLSMDISSSRIAGKDAGLLVFELDTPSNEPFDFWVTWTVRGQPYLNELKGIRFKAGTGLNILPLDALPHWLLAGQLELVRLTPATKSHAKPLIVRKAKLSQRKAAVEQ